VLERENDYWISRRSLEGIFSPEGRFRGFSFNREGYQDPIDALRRMNEIVRTEYDRVAAEKIRIEAGASPSWPRSLSAPRSAGRAGPSFLRKSPAENSGRPPRTAIR